METKTLIAAVIVCSALLGCASAPPRIDGSPPGQAKKVPHVKSQPGSPSCTVNVGFDCPNCYAPCTINVYYEFLVAYKNSKPDIFWNITAATDARFKFAPNNQGIILVDQDDPQQFTGCKTVPNSNDRSFTCKDNQRNNETEIYKYIINIVDSMGSRTPAPLDPWVINN
jgi:hypothetical protein